MTNSPTDTGERRRAVIQLIDERRALAVEWLRALIATDSEAPHERAAQVLLAQIAESSGLAARFIASDHDGQLASHPRFVETGASYEDRPNCVITFPGENTAAYVCNAHIDTVAVGDGWRRNPKGEPDGDYFFGRGACDAKGSAVAVLLAMSCMQAAGVGQGRGLELHSVVDEEPGGNGTLGLLRALYQDQPERASQARLAIVLEPTSLDVLVGHRGMLWYGLSCVGRQAHGSGNAGVNAIEQAADVVASLRELNHRFSTETAGAYGQPRLNVGVIRGGQESYTTPGLCDLEFSARYAPGQRDAVSRQITEALASVSTVNSPIIRYCRDFEASQTPSDDPAVVEMLTASRRHRPSTRIATLAGTCDMRHYRNEWGIPTVVFGPGDLNVAHAADEFVDVREILTTAKIIVELVLNDSASDIAT